MSLDMCLLLVLIRNPLAFLRSITYLLPFRSFSAYTRNHSSLVHDAIGYGLAGMPRDRSGLSYAYAAAHAVARIEIYMASRSVALHGSIGRNVWRKLFGPITPGDNQLYVLAEVVNKITGHPGKGELNTPIDPDRLDQNRVAARYLRGVLGLLSDAKKGGIRGNESRILLTTMIAGIAEASSIVLYLT